MNNLSNYNLVLASGSPRRRQLLEEAGYDFKVIVPDESVEASVSKDLEPCDFVIQASYQKAKYVAEKLENEILIAADTIAECRGQILGKPVDRQHAEEILKMLAGTQHQVLTGVTIWNGENGRHVSHVEATLLQMQEIPEPKLQEYLDSNDWVGKAGAFGYQDGIEWVEIIQGLASNVVGLPVELLPNLLGQLMNDY